MVILRQKSVCLSLIGRVGNIEMNILLPYNRDINFDKPKFKLNKLSYRNFIEIYTFFIGRPSPFVHYYS